MRVTCQKAVAQPLLAQGRYEAHPIGSDDQAAIKN
jgi:hypothetical protein